MPEEKRELSSTELIRQAREEFAPPKLDTRMSTRVDGPSIKELLAVPLSSESLLPQRAVDYWSPDEDDSSDAAWEQIEHSPAPAPGRSDRSGRKVRKRSYVPDPAESELPPMPGELPARRARPDSPPPPWLEPLRGELGLPPASRQPTRTAPQPLGPPVAPPARVKVPWRLLVAGLVALFALVGVLPDDGPTPPTEIGVGDCFSAANFDEADLVDCSQLHRIQVFAVVDVTPNAAGGTLSVCSSRLQEIRIGGNIPDGTVVPAATFVGAIGESTSNPNRTFCYLESPSGDLVGSLFP